MAVGWGVVVGGYCITLWHVSQLKVEHTYWEAQQPAFLYWKAEGWLILKGDERKGQHGRYLQVQEDRGGENGGREMKALPWRQHHL